MMDKFPKSMRILSELQGLQGAIVFNFATREILASLDTGNLNLASVVDTLSQGILRHQQLMNELELYDIVENTLITESRNYHILQILPQFDNVAIYVIVTRYTMLPHITKTLEDAVYSMH